MLGRRKPILNGFQYAHYAWNSGVAAAGEGRPPRFFLGSFLISRVIEQIPGFLVFPGEIQAFVDLHSFLYRAYFIGFNENSGSSKSSIR